MADRSFGPVGPPRYPGAGLQVRSTASEANAARVLAGEVERLTAHAQRTAVAGDELARAERRAQVETEAYRALQVQPQSLWLLALGARVRARSGRLARAAARQWEARRQDHAVVSAAVDEAARTWRSADAAAARVEEHRAAWDRSQQRRHADRRDEP